MYAVRATCPKCFKGNSNERPNKHTMQSSSELNK